MSDMQTLRFYVTPDHDCSYLPGMKAKTLFVDPQAVITSTTYTQLSALGFRRSGGHIYRPHCDQCHACQSVRIPIDSFTPSKTQKRIIKRNADLSVQRVIPTLNDETYRLYQRYINKRHRDGDMHPPSTDQFYNFLVEGGQDTGFYEFRDPTGKLMCVAVTDHLVYSLSALYTFYDPDEEQRSLGANAILWQIMEGNRREDQYLYLGYWVKACRKMSYKTAYKPLEVLIDGHWTRLMQE